MEKFSDIYKRAVERKGSEKMLKLLLAKPLSNKQLLTLNDDDWQVHKKIIVSNKKVKKLLINVSKDFDNSSLLNSTKLHTENRLKPETLYYSDMLGMTWEEAKEKYLGDIGR